MANSENNQETDITAGIQAELDHLIASGTAANTTSGVVLTHPTVKSSMANNANSNNTVMAVNSLSAPNTLLIPSQQGNTLRTIASSANMPAGATQIVTIPQGAAASKVVQNLAKRSLPSSQGQVVTKVIITRNPVTKQPISSAATILTATSTQGTPAVIRTADGRQLVSASGSPLKFVTVSSGAGLPGKNVVIASAPSKTNKLPIAPLKSPTKMVTMKAVGSTTPKKIAPAPQQLMMSVAGSSPKSILVSSTSGGTRTIQMVSASNAGQMLSGVPFQIQSGQSILKAAHNVQPIQVPGTKFPYVRLVTVTTSTTTTTQAKPIAPAPTTMSRSIVTSALAGVQTTAQAQPLKIAIPPVSRSGSTVTTSQPRLIMPANLANSQLKIVTAGSGGQKFANFPPGTTLLTTPGGNMIPVTVLPQSYMGQVPQQTQARVATNQPNFVPIASQNPAPVVAQAQPPPAAPRHAVNGRGPPPDQPGSRPRKPCNCTKSMCLKLYCDCFANGEFCNNCNCNNCQNNLTHEDERAKAIKACLDRNPTAFHPKIGKGRDGQTDRRHNKGCNCKRSGCLKNYCECYEAKILCTASCKCVGCKNFEESPERKTLMHLADAAEVRVQQQTAVQTKLSSQIQEFPVRAQEVTDSGERLPFSFITNEVAEATCQCMLAQAEEVERTSGSNMVAERMILEEFGRCLLQVIQSAGRTRGSIVK
ncbi:LOW QUALITY PROTEIN: protein lin-54 homolog [Amphiura filiformis]|uniref:LOW QUALITY PROTEIN: protein lin-54 homolog n=1 Tax=Amphiura filiformis TaxID=82378 RepID=UPI003B21F02B